MPAERPRRVRHHVGESRAAQRRHRVFTLPRTLEDVAAPIDAASEVAGLARHADLAFHRVVVRLELLQAERPVLDRGPAREA
jgi:hypothetical protein